MDEDIKSEIIFATQDKRLLLHVDVDCVLSLEFSAEKIELLRGVLAAYDAGLTATAHL